ncbi:MAG: regulatory protein RecX, partial [Blautia sp.]
ARHGGARADGRVAGLPRKLEANYPDEVVDEAMEYVKSFGYIDDRRYAENYIRYRFQTKSRLQIFQDLQKKGVAKDVITEAWEAVEAVEEMDERELIRTLLLKKYPSGSRLDEGQMRRLQGFLARRGFSWGDISAVLSQEDISLQREE